MLPFIVTWFGTARLAQTGLVIFFSFVTTALSSERRGNVAGSYEHSAAALGASRRWFCATSSYRRSFRRFWAR